MVEKKGHRQLSPLPAEGMVRMRNTRNCSLKGYFMLFILSTFQKLVYKAEEIYENYTFDEFLDVSIRV